MQGRDARPQHVVRATLVEAGRAREAVSEPLGHPGHPIPGSGPSHNGRHVNSGPSGDGADPDLARDHRGLGSAYLVRNDPDRALASCLQACKIGLQLLDVGFSSDYDRVDVGRPWILTRWTWTSSKTCTRT